MKKKKTIISRYADVNETVNELNAFMLSKEARIVLLAGESKKGTAKRIEATLYGAFILTENQKGKWKDVEWFNENALVRAVEHFNNF